jgi:hypothetical protein
MCSCEGSEMGEKGRTCACLKEAMALGTTLGEKGRTCACLKEAMALGTTLGEKGRTCSCLKEATPPLESRRRMPLPRRLLPLCLVLLPDAVLLPFPGCGDGLRSGSRVGSGGQARARRRGQQAAAVCAAAVGPRRRGTQTKFWIWAPGG